MARCLLIIVARFFDWACDQNLRAHVVEVVEMPWCEIENDDHAIIAASRMNPVRSARSNIWRRSRRWRRRLSPPCPKGARFLFSFDGRQAAHAHGHQGQARADRRMLLTLNALGSDGLVAAAGKGAAGECAGALKRRRIFCLRHRARHTEKV
jgi:hypothetical protein